MNWSYRSTIVLLLLIAVIHAQQKTAQQPQSPPRAKLPTVDCSEAQTSKACNSFKQLFEAHDKDILDRLSSPTTYVCFRPKEDVFLIFHVTEPTPNDWERAEHSRETQKAAAVFAEFRNGVNYHDTFAPGVWIRMNSFDKDPFFKFPDQYAHDRESVFIDPAEITIDYPFDDQHGGTTQYSLVIRRSTGRFLETFAVKTTASSTNSGTCLMYK